jgi:phosphoesterase RecJ-like protein
MKSANVGRPARADDHRAVLPAVAQALRQAGRVLVVMHAHPDGDACGSSLGLALALRERGQDVTLFCHTAVPDNLRFLAGLETMVSSLPADARWDATVVCDVGASHRIGPGLPERPRLGTLLNVDHHLTSDDFGDLNYVDAEAAAVGVMVFRILRELGHPLSRDVAHALYTSLLTDTGSFRYSCTDPEALRTAAELVAAGAEPWHVASHVYEQQPVERLRMLREVLGTLELTEDGRFASLVVTRDLDWVAKGDRSLTDGFIHFARGIRGVEVAAQFSEQPPGAEARWSISLRSRGRVNVAAVAAAFGGGGHHNAAGARLDGTLDEARERILEAVREQISRS